MRASLGGNSWPCRKLGSGHCLGQYGSTNPTSRNFHVSCWEVIPVIVNVRVGVLGPAGCQKGWDKHWTSSRGGHWEGFELCDERGNESARDELRWECGNLKALVICGFVVCRCKDLWSVDARSDDTYSSYPTTSLFYICETANIHQQRKLDRGSPWVWQCQNFHATQTSSEVISIIKPRRSL